MEIRFLFSSWRLFNSLDFMKKRPNVKKRDFKKDIPGQKFLKLLEKSVLNFASSRFYG